MARLGGRSISPTKVRGVSGTPSKRVPLRPIDLLPAGEGHPQRHHLDGLAIRRMV